jgi:hypothetical protein
MKYPHPSASSAVSRIVLHTAILISGLFAATIFAADPVTNSIAGTSAAASPIANLAPPFTGGANAGRKITLSSLRGKPVLLVIAPSPRDRAFRRQMQELRGYYERLAAQGLICFAALTSEGGRIPSNIPFVLVDDAAGTAADYGIEKGFAIAVIGCDGNLDCLSNKPLPGYRINDLVINNAGFQSLLRR